MSSFFCQLTHGQFCLLCRVFHLTFLELDLEHLDGLLELPNLCIPLGQELLGSVLVQGGEGGGQATAHRLAPGGTLEIQEWWGLETIEFKTEVWQKGNYLAREE